MPRHFLRAKKSPRDNLPCPTAGLALLLYSIGKVYTLPKCISYTPYINLTHEFTSRSTNLTEHVLNVSTPTPTLAPCALGARSRAIRSHCGSQLRRNPQGQIPNA
jgi:hypothetical protein